jgi:hypothetical protein
LLDVPHRAKCSITRVFWSYSLGNSLLHLPLQVVADFFVKLLFDRVTMKERAEP